MASISIQKNYHNGRLVSRARTEFDHLGSNHFGSKVHLEFSVAFAPRFWMEGAVLDWQGLSPAGFADGTHVQLTVADWLQLGGGVECKVEQPEPANPPDSATTSECIDYTHYTEVEIEEEKVTPGERVPPGRHLRSRTRPHSASGKRVSPPRVSRSRSPLPRRGCGTCQHNQTDTAGLP